MGRRPRLHRLAPSAAGASHQRAAPPERHRRKLTTRAAPAVLVPGRSLPSFFDGLYYAVPSSHVLRALAVSQFYCRGSDCPRIDVGGGGGETADRFGVVLAQLSLRPDYEHEFAWEETGWAALAFAVLAAVACAALVVRAARAS